MNRIFSGVQPTGNLHLGNYLGAIRNWVGLQKDFDCIFCIVDLHAITQPYDTATLAPRTLEMAVGLLAAGLDPSRCTLFVQSHVPQHAELMWLLNTVTPLGELERMMLGDKTLARGGFMRQGMRQLMDAYGLSHYWLRVMPDNERTIAFHKRNGFLPVSDHGGEYENTLGEKGEYLTMARSYDGYWPDVPPRA